MKYEEQLFNLSKEACDKIKPSNDKNDKEIKEKQDKILKIFLEKFQEQLKTNNETKDGLLKVRFENRFYSSYNDGYQEIKELLSTGNFGSFAAEYCMYLDDLEHRCNEWFNAYYEITWDYKSYFEQIQKQNNYLALPYPIGSYVTTYENDTLHIDKIHQYVYDKNGLGVILELETLVDPRLSIRIDIKEFINNWNLYDTSKNTTKKRKKQL